MKTCGRCKTENPLADFYKSTAYKSGYDYCCKRCRLDAVERSRQKWKDRKGAVKRDEFGTRIISDYGIPEEFLKWACSSPNQACGE